MNVLIVEDDPVLAQLYRDELSEYTLNIVDTVDAAKVSLQVSLPDCIIVDIMLPGGKNGFDLLEEIQRNIRWNTIPVIILTNLESEQQVALGMGYKHFLVKSNLDISDLKGYIRRVTEN